MTVMINGSLQRGDEASISIYDPIVLRGDGCFEATRIYEGRPFRLWDHLHRLQRSAAALCIDLPPITDIEEWANTVARRAGDGVLRILVSAGTDGTTTVVVLDHPVPDLPARFRLMPIEVPWHPAGAEWDLAGVKTLSYAPNMAATRRAQAHGFDDALLLSRDRIVLEMPTSSVVWAVDGVLETPSLDLGILESVTRRVVLELCDGLGLELREGRYPFDRLAAADEAAVLSSVREVRPIVAIGDVAYEPGPLTARLADAFAETVRSELGL
jgi:branched-chain amino acid aminotransferase